MRIHAGLTEEARAVVALTDVSYRNPCQDCVRDNPKRDYDDNPTASFMVYTRRGKYGGTHPRMLCASHVNARAVDGKAFAS